MLTSASLKHVDLGDLEGPVMLFGGPYSNLQALRALMARAVAMGVPPERMICTGDTVAYCGDPVAVVDCLRSLGCPVLAGNCERQLAAGAADCGCGFDEGSACDLLSAGWYGHASASLGEGARTWMAGLPDLISFTHEGLRAAVIHGGTSDISRFLWPDSPEAEFAAEIALIEAAVGPVDLIVAGHCGMAFEREIGAHRWLNAGVIGMPPNDGRSDTRFMVLDGQTVRIERLCYNVAGAVRAMEAAGLRQGYETALQSGYWPSEDILPPSLRQRAEAVTVTGR